MSCRRPPTPRSIYIGPEPQYPQQAQQPPRGGAWGDRDRDGVPNAYDQYNNNRRRGMGDQDRDGIPNRYDTDRDGDGRPNQWDRSPANPNWRIASALLALVSQQKGRP